MSDFDVARIRQDTPACRDLVHFNNAGAALMPRPVVDAVVGHLRDEERFGGYEAEKRAVEKDLPTRPLSLSQFDPNPPVRFLQSCPTLSPAVSRFAATKQPFGASGSGHKKPLPFSAHLVE